MCAFLYVCMAYFFYKEVNTQSVIKLQLLLSCFLFVSQSNLRKKTESLVLDLSLSANTSYVFLRIANRYIILFFCFIE